jgi:hypothetical protein
MNQSGDEHRFSGARQAGNTKPQRRTDEACGKIGESACRNAAAVQNVGEVYDLSDPGYAQ